MRDGERVLHLGGAKQRSVLAILLLHAGEVVSTDRLIDELWGESPPEDAPTALHQHVSRLRRLLEPHTVVRTQPPGYVAELVEGARDVDRFRALREDGRRALDEGRPQEAAAMLREALALWRGRPLADLEHEHFARDAVAALDEAWLEALELRVDADLALGRHGVLVSELQALARRHPLRERLRGQLMLALYRSGRQADALAAFADLRRELVDQLGLEPGPDLRRLQQAILDHDPELDLRRRPLAQGPRRSRGRVAAGLAVVAAVLLGAGALVSAGDDGDGEGLAPPARTGGELAAVDVATGTVRRRLPAGRTPASITAGDGALWVVDGDAQTLLRVDPRSGAVETLATGATPTDLVSGAGAIWIANGTPLEDAQFVGPVATEIVRLDSTTRTQRGRIALPPSRGAVSNGVENRLAVTADAVWAVTAAGSVVRIDPRTAAITASADGIQAVAVGAGGAGVWALLAGGSAVSLDERSARVRRRVELPTAGPTAIAVGDDAAWATSATEGVLWRIGDGETVGSLQLGSGVTDIAVAPGQVWVANPIDGTVTAVDPASSRVLRSVRVGGIPRSIAIDGDTLWVALTGTAPPAGEQVSGVTPLPASMCEPVVAGSGGRADVLIASDLPLQGGVRITTTQMAQAVTFVLREHGFRAGRFRVAYQSCDDSLARTGLFDEAKCAANARAYGAHRHLVAVVGPFNSPCAAAALPELNRAGGGAVPTISPLNSFVGLTRQGPGVPPGLLASLYPTGRRNYLRVFPTDDLQGAALALFARDRGWRDVFVLDDGEPGYGELMATGFDTAARRIGLNVAGRATWRPTARGYAGLARRVARSGAQAVFVGGLIDSNAAQMVRDLRTHAGRGVEILGPDGLTPLALLERSAGPAARGVFVSLAGAVIERLPPAGTAWVSRFARTQSGVEVEPSAVYAAQATEVVLDALARSDGTRASVLDELFRTRVTGGLLGDFSFDERGDITESPVTILRVVGGGSSTRVGSVEGGVVERVSRPTANLVAGGADESG